MTYTRRRRRWPFVVVAIVVVVVGALVAVDLAARSATETAIAKDVRRSTHARSVTVGISSFPFLYDVAVEGRLGHITITGHDVPVGPLTLDQVTLSADQVHFDRHLLVSDHKVAITSVARADVTVVARLSSLEATVASKLDVQIVASGSNRLDLTAAGHTLFTVDLTKVPLIPVCPLQVLHGSGTYTLTCSVSPVPASVLAALSHQG